MFTACLKKYGWRLALASALVFFPLTGCASYYKYKYVTNVDPSKKKSSFDADADTCNKKSVQRSKPTVASIHVPSSDDADVKKIKHYEECMYRQGWRLKYH